MRPIPDREPDQWDLRGGGHLVDGAKLHPPRPAAPFVPPRRRWPVAQMAAPACSSSVFFLLR
jgi:hypothetical protein